MASTSASSPAAIADEVTLQIALAAADDRLPAVLRAMIEVVGSKGKANPEIGQMLVEKADHESPIVRKTALLWQALLRFAPSFELTLAIGLDPLPSLESVLGRIERFLGLPSPCANDTKEREALVRNALTSKRMLLGLDNFETLNHAVQSQETLESAKTAKSLYAFFKSLPAASVTLCVTSREKTNLPGEHIEEIYGLEDAMGGALFYENVSTRKDALNEEGLEKLSAAVGGHPLALRLLAPIFEEQAGLSLDKFIENVQTFLPKASDQWTEEERHESLGACFAFSMDNLPKTEEGKVLQNALTRLSMFIAFFAPMFVAPVVANKWPETTDEEKEQIENAEKISHALWERGLLEQIVLPSEEESFYLYRLHPALGIFARERLTDIETVKGNYLKSMSGLAKITEEQISKNPLMAQIALRAVPDLLIAAEPKNASDDNYDALMQTRVGELFLQFGLYDDALRFLQTALETNERLNNPIGKSVVITIMAKLQAARGDLDGAMKLFQQLLEIDENRGSVAAHHKATTIGEMGNIYMRRGDLDSAMKLYKQSIKVFDGLGNTGADGKATMLAMMAGFYVERGNLDRAMQFYCQSLEIGEGLGDLKLMAEVVSEPTWNNYAATYVDMNGVSQTVNLRQPFFHTRKVDQTISLRNRTTVMMGGMVTSGKRQVEERIPVLGRIPLLGRLFCRSYEVDDSRKLLITVTASVVPDL